MLPIDRCRSTRCRCAAWFTLAVSLACHAGCDSGPKRYHISGKATFQGQPIPLGVVLFQPEGQEGADAAGFAHIKDGWYDTRNHGKGIIGGPHRIQIQGFDGKPPPKQDLPLGVPLFPDYATTAELPKENSTRDFDVLPPGKPRRPSS